MFYTSGFLAILKENVTIQRQFAAFLLQPFKVQNFLVDYFPFRQYNTKVDINNYLNISLIIRRNL
ncbi:hypothetical protein ACH95_02025 [Bacillus glycinifermentans]|nr:hypothetical protein ACH95_02025 [Bacillus glycinifermentans]